jgi:catechol 2,3-dioxygenase-like lactoylglutathione lyase family enzyme
VRTSFLLTLMASLLAAFTGAHAAGLHGNGYVTLAVPDLPQAVAFFQNILDCEPVDAMDPTAPRPQHTLLLCESDTVVELFDGHGVPAPVSARNAPVRFFANDVGHADQWLRREGVKVVGAPVIPSTGPQAGMTLVNFVTPWGQPLQLIGRDDVQVTAVP